MTARSKPADDDDGEEPLCVVSVEIGYVSDVSANELVLVQVEGTRIPGTT